MGARRPSPSQVLPFLASICLGTQARRTHPCARSGLHPFLLQLSGVAQAHYRQEQRMVGLVSHLSHSPLIFLCPCLSSRNLSSLPKVPSAFLQPWRL